MDEGDEGSARGKEEGGDGLNRGEKEQKSKEIKNNFSGKKCLFFWKWVEFYMIGLLINIY